MEQQAFLIHALSPLHPGTGQALGVVDLPVARYKATGIPFLPGSSVKGVLRDAMSNPGLDAAAHEYRFCAAFGPSTEKAAKHAGAVAFGDARLLLLPVRSLKGTFAYVTSPLLLRLALRDVANPAAALRAPEVANAQAKVKVAPGSLIERKYTDGGREHRHVFFEDLERVSEEDALVGTLGDWLGQHLFSDAAEKTALKSRLAVVDDETMTFFWETCTQIDARVRINDRGVVQDGALWYEESLPAETVLVGVAGASKSFRGPSEGVARATPRELIDWCVTDRDNLQFGGKATVGRGRARMRTLTGAVTP